MRRKSMISIRLFLPYMQWINLGTRLLLKLVSPLLFIFSCSINQEEELGKKTLQIKTHQKKRFQIHSFFSTHSKKVIIILQVYLWTNMSVSNHVSRPVCPFGMTYIQNKEEKKCKDSTWRKAAKNKYRGGISYGDWGGQGGSSWSGSGFTGLEVVLAHGASDATTSSSLIVSLIMISLDDFLPPKPAIFVVRK